jgi:hypothetical protein
MIASLERPERLEAHVKWIVSLVAACQISVPLRPQDLSSTTNACANSQASSELTLSERLAREYEKQAGLGSTPELARISRYLGSVGRQVASVLPSHLQYHFVYDPNPDFKSAFALPGGYIIVGGGLLAITQTEDELARNLVTRVASSVIGSTRPDSVRGIAWQELHPQPSTLLADELPCHAAAMAGESVPDDQQLAGNVGQQVSDVVELLQELASQAKNPIDLQLILVALKDCIGEKE